MTDEKNSRNDAGRSPDDAADFDAPEQPTEVIVPRAFIVRSIRNCADHFVAAGGTLRQLAGVVESGGGPLALEEVDDAIRDLRDMLDGALRAHARVKPGLKTEGTRP